MKDTSEVEKTSFLNCSENKSQNGSSARAKVVEVTYDLTGSNRKGPDKEELPNFLSLCDFLLVTTVVLVNVVGFWRGLFGILFQFHENYQLSILYVLGSLIYFHFTVSRQAYKRQLERKSFVNTILRKAYTYVFGSACVVQWAGLWYILDNLTGFEVLPPLVYSSVCGVFLACLKLFRNILAPPLSFSTDKIAGSFDFQTVFKTTLSNKGSSEISLYILDCFFSVFVIGSLVVFVWRGVWCLTDVFLFPENDKLSALTSTAIGYGIVILIFSVQRPMEKICDRLKGFWRILIADIYVLVSFVGTINLWRGIWNLLNIYFLPESPILSCWITHLGSFAFLILINCSNSVLVRGVYLDGEEGGKCVVFPIFYLRLIFEDQLRKKTENNQVNHKISTLSVISPDLEKGQKQNSDFTKGSIQSSDTAEGKS